MKLDDIRTMYINAMRSEFEAHMVKVSRRDWRCTESYVPEAVQIINKLSHVLSTLNEIEDEVTELTQLEKGKKPCSTK